MGIDLFKIEILFQKGWEMNATSLPQHTISILTRHRHTYDKDILLNHQSLNEIVVSIRLYVCMYVRNWNEWIVAEHSQEAIYYCKCTDVDNGHYHFCVGNKIKTWSNLVLM